ncbi:MAG TPA: acyl carrier protein [Candidatus Dormibacteraeota bacterium]|jgi:acyl carrier protein
MSAGDQVDRRLRLLLADVLGSDPAELVGIPAETPLFRAGLDLDSLTGMVLLGRINQEFGVDVAAGDLELDCLDSLGTLADYVTAHTSPR